MDFRIGLTTLLAVLVIAHLSGGLPAAQNKSPESPRPIAELAFAMLKPDVTIPVELERGTAVNSDALFVPLHSAGAVVQIDSKNNTADKPLVIGKPSCGALAIAFESLWVPQCEAKSVARVSITHGNVTASMPLPIASPEAPIAVAAESVWLITDAKGVVSRIDPGTNAAVAEIYIAPKPVALAAQDDVVWVTSEEGDLLTRINAHTNVVSETIKVGPRPGAVAVGEAAVWTLNRGDGSVTRVDAKTNKVVTTIGIGADMKEAALAVGEGSVWLSARGVPIVRIDPRTNRVVQRFTGAGGGAIVVAHGSLWIAAGPKLMWRVDPRLVAAMRP